MEQPKNTQELELLKSKKMETFYKVKDNPGTITKDVDMTKRIVQSIPNTYNFFDSDSDVLLPGCAAKSIQEGGPNGTGAAKIKNVKDHNISIRIGKPTLLDERIYDYKSVMFGESKMLTTTAGNDQLIEYQEGVIDQHSIGFQYLDLEFITADAKDWKTWVNKLINPKDAEDAGYMFLVKEIKLFEWSPVSFGANELTPYLGVKSGNKDALRLKINNRLDLLEKQLRTGKQSDLAMLDYELETLQLKQIINELFNQQPSIKDTLLAQGRLKEDTTKGTSLTICKNCNHSFNYSTDEKQVNCPDCGQFVDKDGNFTVSFDWGKALKETTFIKI
jgi:hypothetical protein